ncbi:glycosyltransferase family 4 protein, partial [Pseudokineococcus marinus]|uniref:glycosyltransferase family 4 protein n=1 Tax=Pseudokineococcus marinus TaxID=351215 RepID=UPI0031E4309A
LGGAGSGPAAESGGSAYERRLVDAVGDLGVDARLVPVPGDWPGGGAEDRERLLAAVLDASAEGVVLVDGLVGSGAPDVLERARDAGVRAHLLVHLPLHEETGLASARAEHLAGLEALALAVVAGAVAPSAWLAARLPRAAGGAAPPVVVARPGTDAAAPAAGSSPPFLLHLAAVVPRKAQDVVVAALARLTDLPWTAGLVGDDRRDPAYTARVQAAVEAHGLADRVAVTGAVGGAALDAVRHAADLVLLPSRAEPWGMAVAEGLARGVPAVVAAGTGSAEVLGVGEGDAPEGGAEETADLPGALVPAGDAVALEHALRRLLTGADDPAGPLGRARAAARRRGAELPGWEATARAVVDGLGLAP